MSLFAVIGLVGFSIWSLYGFYRCLGQVIDKYEAKNTLHFGYLMLTVFNLVGFMMLPATMEMISWNGINY